MTATIPERVARGVALLDEREPGWADRIDLERLDVEDPCGCVLGQTWDGPTLGGDPFIKHVDALLSDRTYSTAAAYGFDAYYFDGRDFGQLTAEWRAVIAERRTEAGETP